MNAGWLLGCTLQEDSIVSWRYVYARFRGGIMMVDYWYTPLSTWWYVKWITQLRLHEDPLFGIHCSMVVRYLHASMAAIWGALMGDSMAWSPLFHSGTLPGRIHGGYMMVHYWKTQLFHGGRLRNILHSGYMLMHYWSTPRFHCGFITWIT